MDFGAGTVLEDRFEIVGLISRGGMGEVYRARTLAEPRTDVAVKRLLDHRHAARFVIEARLLAQLGHPRVVRVLDHFTVGDDAFLVMTLVEGENLEQRLLRTGTPGLEAAEAVAFVREACEALAYVHGESVVHRDVKPGNLVASDDGIVLVDFGIAREMTGDAARSTRAIGTPGFMAPEVLVGGAASPRSDVYGLAATLFCLLCGRPPRYGERPVEVGEVLEHVLSAGLESDPLRRIPTAEAFAGALGQELAPTRGASFAVTVAQPAVPAPLLEAIVTSAAQVFDASASSWALVDPAGDLHFEAAWGAGSREICGVRVPAGTGLVGAVAATGVGDAIADVRADPRWARDIGEPTGYIPNTMILLPVAVDGRVVAVLTILDRRDGRVYGPGDLLRARSFVDLVTFALRNGAFEEPPTLPSG